MSRFFHLFPGTAVALCLPASVALADLTAEEVWADWQSYMESAGYDVTASTATRDGSVVVSNMELSVDIDPNTDVGQFVIRMDTVTFAEQGDGTVAIQLPDRTVMDMSVLTEAGERADVVLRFDQTAHSMVATGDAESKTYSYSADAVRMFMDELVIDDVAVGPNVAKVDVTMTDIDQIATTSVGDIRSASQDMTIASVAYEIAFANPDTEDTLKFAGSIQGVKLDGSGDLPLDTNVQDLNAMLNAGFQAAANLTSQSGSYAMTFDSKSDGGGTINSTSEGAKFEVSIGENGLLYDVSQSNVDVNALMTEFPLPVSFSMAEAGMRFVMPLQRSTEDQDFGLAFSLRDFSMSDAIWNLFDAEAQLPRDPATLVMDVSGKAKLLLDIVDPAQAAILAQSDAFPAELNTLEINEITLDAVGTNVTGNGDFVFDNSDLETFDGLPRPKGTLDVQVSGANGLIDKLVALGFVPQEQAIGARLMMGLFTVPGEGEDTLTSQIEINDEGHILANGQRLR